MLELMQLMYHIKQYQSLGLKLKALNGQYTLLPIFDIRPIIIQPNVDIQHVGSCAIPGAIGKFDVDIQIRVSKNDFASALEILKEKYIAKHLELWTDEFAIFLNPDPSVDIDYLLTVFDSRYDDFYRTRDYLISHPEKLREYNELKMKFEGKLYHEYRKAKQKFLGSNGNVPFLKY
jgi:GrpB-like predicted nucleotidyltransferase (UPF0157 family)